MRVCERASECAHLCAHLCAFSCFTAYSKVHVLCASLIRMCRVSNGTLHEYAVLYGAGLLADRILCCHVVLCVKIEEGVHRLKYRY